MIYKEQGKGTIDLTKIYLSKIGLAIQILIPFFRALIKMVPIMLVTKVAIHAMSFGQCYLRSTD